MMLIFNHKGTFYNGQTSYIINIVYLEDANQEISS